MTTYYPELPEPWNNLAAEYIAQDKLDLALEALKMALTADPSYALARANMGEVQLMLANDTYRQAAASGVPKAAQRAQQTGQILQQ
jgi:Tfp pilus assembly protein PilF